MNDDILTIQNKIERVIVSWNMLPEGCTVIVGLSGGADSMALTHFLLKYANSRYIHILAAHINHGLRGAEANCDERFVTNWCRENRVELRVLHADVRALAQERGQGLEECGRNVRYAFFHSLCKENSETRIATAHTLSDSAETVLMNLAKGTGTRGLRGIPPVRGNIIRPLIEITRAEVERYCKSYGISFVTDSTNLTEEYARNKIRLSVVPALKEINPAFETAVLGMTQRLREDEEYFMSLAQEKLSNAEHRGGYRLDQLAALPRPVLNRAVMLAVRRVTKARLESAHINAVTGIIRSGLGAVTISGGIQCTAQGNTLFITGSNEAEKSWNVPFRPEGTLLPDGRRMIISKLSKKEYENRYKINNLLFNNVINYDTIFKITSVRNRSNGDIFRPAGRKVTKSLKKLFNEAGLEPMLRSKLAMLESGGEIVWIEGFGASQDFSVMNSTENVAEITII